MGFDSGKKRWLQRRSCKDAKKTSLWDSNMDSKWDTLEAGKDGGILVWKTNAGKFDVPERVSGHVYVQGICHVT